MSKDWSPSREGQHLGQDGYRGIVSMVPLFQKRELCRTRILINGATVFSRYKLLTTLAVHVLPEVFTSPRDEPSGTCLG